MGGGTELQIAKKYLCLNLLQFLPILGHSFCRSIETRDSNDMMVMAMMMMTIKMPINDDVVDNDELMSCPVGEEGEEGGMQPLRPSNWFVATLASGNNPLLPLMRMMKMMMMTMMTMLLMMMMVMMLQMVRCHALLGQ